MYFLFIVYEVIKETKHPFNLRNLLKICKTVSFIETNKILDILANSSHYIMPLHHSFNEKYYEKYGPCSYMLIDIEREGNYFKKILKAIF